MMSIKDVPVYRPSEYYDGTVRALSPISAVSAGAGDIGSK